jgi:four helix bundle protein
MKHEESGLRVWMEGVPAEIRGDSLWLVEAYRLSLFLGDLAWQDSNCLAEDARMIHVADQLRRATSRISANIAEGYSRETGKARATYYEYALGSARESRDWYYKARFNLQPHFLEARTLHANYPPNAENGRHGTPK